MKQAHLIAVNTIIIWGTTALQMIPPLVMVPFLVHSLGDSGYGEYALIWSLLMAIEQLEGSLQSGGVKYGAAYLAQGRIAEVNKVLSSSFVFSVGLGLLSAAAIAMSALISFKGSTGMKASILIVAVMMVFLAPTTPFLGIIRARQRHFVNSLFAITSQYVGLGLTFLWFSLVRPSVEALITILAGSLLVSRLAQVPVAYKLVPGLRNNPRAFDKPTFRMILGFGSMVVLVSLALTANSTGMRWVSGILVSTTFVAHLAIFLMPGTMMAQVVQAMTITVMPAASAYEASANGPMLRELFLRSTRYIVLLCSAGLLAALLLVGDGLRLWVGSQYRFLGVYTFVNLVGVSILMSSSCAHQMLKGLGALPKILRAFALGLVAVVFAVFLAVYAVLKSPYIAVSAGLLAGNVTAATLQLGACARRVELGRRELVVRGFLQPLAPALAGLGLIGAFSLLGGLGHLAMRAAAAVLAVATAFGGFYGLIARADERRQFKEIFQVVRGRLQGALGPWAPGRTGTDV